MTTKNLHQSFESELRQNESLLWVGKPCGLPIRTISMLSAFFLLTFGFLIMPLAYALFTGDKSVFQSMTYTINGQRLDADTPDETLLNGVIMLAVMLAVFAAGFIYWIYARTKEIYAVTQTRAIIVKHFPFRRLASINLHNLVRIEKNGNTKIGTLSLFSEKPSLVEKLLNFYGHQANSFMSIRNPYEVESIILAGFSPAEESGPK